MEYSTDIQLNEETGFVTIAVFIIFLLCIAFFKKPYHLFKEERDYIKMEMERSLSEEEYIYWKRELKILYISKIPIIRSVFGRKHNR